MKIEKDAVEELMQYGWSGNIRELRNVVERLLILSNGVITRDDVITYAIPADR